MQWTSDEKYALRMIKDQIHVYDTSDFEKPTWVLQVENATSYQVSPGDGYRLAVFSSEKKASPGRISIYQFFSDKPFSSRSFFKAERAIIHWNKLGSSLLCLTSVEVDKTNQSYYGEKNLYFLSNESERVDLGMKISGDTTHCLTGRYIDKEGPIHDVAWSENSDRFFVTYGCKYMLLAA